MLCLITQNLKQLFQVLLWESKWYRHRWIKRHNERVKKNLHLKFDAMDEYVDRTSNAWKSPQ